MAGSGKCKLGLGLFGLIGVKQLVASRALIVCGKAGRLAGGFHLGNQVAVGMSGSGNFFLINLFYKSGIGESGRRVTSLTDCLALRSRRHLVACRYGFFFHMACVGFANALSRALGVILVPRVRRNVPRMIHDRNGFCLGLCFKGRVCKDSGVNFGSGASAGRGLIGYLRLHFFTLYVCAVVCANTLGGAMRKIIAPGIGRSSISMAGGGYLIGNDRLTAASAGVCGATHLGTSRCADNACIKVVNGYAPVGFLHRNRYRCLRIARCISRHYIFLAALHVQCSVSVKRFLSAERKGDQMPGFFGVKITDFPSIVIIYAGGSVCLRLNFNLGRCSKDRAAGVNGLSAFVHDRLYGLGIVLYIECQSGHAGVGCNCYTDIKGIAGFNGNNRIL